MSSAIKYGVVVKPGVIPSFYASCPSEHRPSKITQLTEGYVYDYAEGKRAGGADVAMILRICKKKIWTPLNCLIDEATVCIYGRYVSGRATQYVPVKWHAVVNHAIKIIRSMPLPLVMLVHGDLTLENVIIREGKGLIFIDPGDAHNMRTSAIDRGKLLQSVFLRWEARGWSRPNPWPSWGDSVDWAFLVTHWVRLIRHWPRLYTISAFKILQRAGP